jgi:hypothetical protein
MLYGAFCVFSHRYRRIEGDPFDSSGSVSS